MPSAGALYPLELHVVCRKVTPLGAGVYRYRPERHQLLRVAPGYPGEELVAAACGQEWIATAPAVICIAAVFERTTVKYGHRGRSYVFMEAGHAAESLMLQAVALGLGATMVGAFTDDEVKRLVHLDANEAPLCLIGAPHQIADGDVIMRGFLDLAIIGKILVSFALKSFDEHQLVQCTRSRRWMRKSRPHAMRCGKGDRNAH